MGIKSIFFATLAFLIVAATQAEAITPTVRSAAVCTTETGGVQYEFCIDNSAELSGVWQCSTEACEADGWLRADVNYTGTFRGAAIQRNTSIQISSGGTWPTLNQELLDVGGWHATNSDKLIVPTGVTHVKFCVSMGWNTSLLGWSLMEVRKSGVHLRGLPSFTRELMQQDGDETSYHDITVCGGVIEVTATDQFNVYVRTSPGAKSVLGTDWSKNIAFFSVMEVK